MTRLIHPRKMKKKNAAGHDKDYAVYQCLPPPGTDKARACEHCLLVTHCDEYLRTDVPVTEFTAKQKSVPVSYH